MPIEIKMSRILLIGLLSLAVCLASCQKSAEFGSVQYAAQAKLDDDSIAQYIQKYGLTGVAKHVQNNDTIGVYYIVINPGQANTLYTTSTQITVGDTCRKLYLSARKGPVVFATNAFHPTYSLGQLLTCWQLGVPEVGVGGEVELLVPSRYAYGPYPQGDLGLPANAILDFYITVYSVTN